MFLIYKAFEWSSGQLRTLHAMQLKRLLMREFMQFPDISVTKPFKKIKSQVFANYFKESFHAHLRNSTYYAVKNNSFRRSLCSFFWEPRMGTWFLSKLCANKDFGVCHYIVVFSQPCHCDCMIAKLECIISGVLF